MRDLYTPSSSRPLYSYQVTVQEYQELRQVLLEHRRYAFDLRYEHDWAACFCLYVAECFRREYDGGDGGWAWSMFEKRLGCTFTQAQHAQLVTTGLARYWQRPIRQRERGRDLLGSLFTEGGLPWLLVQTESHGFGRSVRKGLRDFYRARQGHRTTTDLMADYEQYLPQTFRNLETRQLLAGIVEQLMHLVEQHPLREQSDPAGYLDKISSRWRAAFPIPLDESNARGLINEWLKDAGERRQERKEAEARVQAFTCSHRLYGDLPDWCIQTEVLIPRDASIPMGGRHLSNTRMEICFYEGERMLAKGGAVYGQLEGETLSVRFPVVQLSLRRRVPQDPLTMRLLENGNTVHIFHFAHSVLEYDDLPLIFEAKGDEWWFVSSASCSVASSRARIRLPAHVGTVDSATAVIVCDKDGGRWLDSTEPLRIVDGQSLISVRLNQPQGLVNRAELQGNCVSYGSTPATVYLGWPRLVLSPEATIPEEALSVYVNGNKIVTRPRRMAGQVRYGVRNVQGETILQRRFGVLPEGFRLSLQPALANRPARMQIWPHTLEVRVIGDSLHANTAVNYQAIVVELQSVGKDIPTGFSVAISDSADVEPVVLHLPFPYQGARLIGSDATPLDTKDLTLDELAGMRVLLSSGLPYGQRFMVVMELIGHAQQRLTRRYIVEVGNVPIEVSLFSYQNDIAQMLGAVNDQDAYIRLTLESEKRLLSLNVRRYNGQVHWLSPMRFEIRGSRPGEFQHGAKAAAMLLSDPRQPPVAIPERESEGVGTGMFSTPPTMERDAPWLIYPQKDSAVKFRPVLYIPFEHGSPGCSSLTHVATTVRSMHDAARVYHPQFRPCVINEQIAEMATDFGHSGWQYLADLKSHYGHLPLSTFKSWCSLAEHHEALAAAVFKLEIDEAFCERIRDELAVIWECIALPLWATVYQRFRDWLALQALPEVLQHHVLMNRRAVLPAVMSGFQYVDNYLETANASHLKKAPVHLVLPEWYQCLRRTHEANNHWPTDLSSALSAWVRQQELPAQIKNLSQIEYTDAVTYLPIFMAYVTAGKVQLDALNANTAYMKFAVKMISDFDRNGWYACVHAMMVSYLLSSDCQG